MATSSSGDCTVNLNVSGYGTGENVVITYGSPKPLSASVFGDQYASYTVTDIDSAPMVSGQVTLTQTIDETENGIIDEELGQGYYWDFNIFTEYEYTEQGYETIGRYEFIIDTLTFSYVVLTDYTVEPPVSVNLTTTVIGSSESPAVCDTFVYVKGAASDAYGETNRDVLFIPYQNER